MKYVTIFVLNVLFLSNKYICFLTSMFYIQQSNKIRFKTQIPYVMLQKWIHLNKEIA